MNEQDDLLCVHCEGRGLLKNDLEVGRGLRTIRERFGLEQRSMATAMQVSASYLSDLERGRRNWSSMLVTRYRQALDRLAVTQQGNQEENVDHA